MLSASFNDDKIAWHENSTADFGDAPVPYPTVHSGNDAHHIATGPTLGNTRDHDLDGTHSPLADADGADEDGVTFGTIQVGALNQQVTVNVQGSPAKLDAWIDFNGDGSWGGPGERIFDSKEVVNGDNVLEFDVPAWALSGTACARFRLSTDGNLGTGGLAADGEVEDYRVTIRTPTLSTGVFGAEQPIAALGDANEGANGARSVFVADIDGDGDIDVLSASFFDNKIAWYENNGSASFTPHVISTGADGATSVFAADVDGDGDIDVLSASSFDGKIAWYEQIDSDPVLDSIGDKTVDEGTELSFNATAVDFDQPPQQLTFSLGTGAPVGASITPAGVFTWTPTEA